MFCLDIGRFRHCYQLSVTVRNLNSVNVYGFYWRNSFFKFLLDGELPEFLILRVKTKRAYSIVITKALSLILMERDAVLTVLVVVKEHIIITPTSF